MNQILDFLIEFKSFSKKNFSKKEESSIRFFSRIRSCKYNVISFVKKFFLKEKSLRKKNGILLSRNSGI